MCLGKSMMPVAVSVSADLSLLVDNQYTWKGTTQHHSPFVEPFMTWLRFQDSSAPLFTFYMYRAVSDTVYPPMMLAYCGVLKLTKV